MYDATFRLAICAIGGFPGPKLAFFRQNQNLLTLSQALFCTLAPRENWRCYNGSQYIAFIADVLFVAACISAKYLLVAAAFSIEVPIAIFRPKDFCRRLA